MHKIRTTRRLATWGMFAIAGAVTLGACGDDDEDDASTDTTTAAESTPDSTTSPDDTTDDTAGGGEPGAVLISGYTFVPTPITVSAGDTVTWTNDDDFPHTSTSDDDVWDSEPIDTDAAFEFTFDEPGTYAYFCAIHNYMQGEVVVE